MHEFISGLPEGPLESGLESGVPLNIFQIPLKNFKGVKFKAPRTLGLKTTCPVASDYQ